MENSSKLRPRRVIISRELAEQALREGAQRAFCTVDVPADVQIVGCRMNERMDLELLVHSESFEPVPYGEVVPLMAITCKAAEPDAPTTSVPKPPKPSHAKASRILAHRFWQLSHAAQMNIALDLKLWTDDDEPSTELEKITTILSRASKRKQLGELWNLVESKHADGRYPFNIFAGQ